MQEAAVVPQRVCASFVFPVRPKWKWAATWSAGEREREEQQAESSTSMHPFQACECTETLSSYILARQDTRTHVHAHQGRHTTLTQTHTHSHTHTTQTFWPCVGSMGLTSEKSSCFTDRMVYAYTELTNVKSTAPTARFLRLNGFIACALVPAILVATRCACDWFLFMLAGCTKRRLSNKKKKKKKKKNKEEEESVSGGNYACVLFGFLLSFVLLRSCSPKKESLFASPKKESEHVLFLACLLLFVCLSFFLSFFFFFALSAWSQNPSVGDNKQVDSSFTFTFF